MHHQKKVILTVAYGIKDTKRVQEYGNRIFCILIYIMAGGKRGYCGKHRERAVLMVLKLLSKAISD